MIGILWVLHYSMHVHNVIILYVCTYTCAWSLINLGQSVCIKIIIIISFSYNVIQSCCAGCSPHQLSDGTPLPSSATCDVPMHSLGIPNGIVCYSGIDTGAIAVYSCFSCASGIRERPSPTVRTCLQNGTWNGIIPQCECGKMIHCPPSPSPTHCEHTQYN